MKNEPKLLVGEDMICPITKEHCDDECCPPGATCNLQDEEITNEFGEKPNLKK